MAENGSNREPGSPVADEYRFQLADYLAMIAGRMRLVYLTAVIAALLSYCMTAVKPRLYEADTILYIVPQNRGDGPLARLSALFEPSDVETQLGIISSRAIAERVVRELGMNLFVKRLDGTGIADRLVTLGERLLRIDSRPEPPVLEFTAVSTRDAAVDWAFKVRSEGDGEFALIDSEGRYKPEGEEFARARLGEELVYKDISFIITKSRLEKGESALVIVGDFFDAVDYLTGGVTVERHGELTSLVRIAVVDTDPVAAADIANSVSRNYVKENISQNARAASLSSKFIEEQLQKVQSELSGAQEKVDKFKIAKGTLVLDEEARLMVGVLSDLRTERSKLELKSKRYRRMLDGVGSGVGGGGGFLLSANEAEDSIISRLVLRLSDLEVERRETLATYSEESAAVQAIDRQITDLRRQIRSALRNGLSGITSQITGLDDEIADTEAKMRDLPEVQTELANISLDVEVGEKMYAYLLEKQQESRIIEASTVGNARVVDPAVAPRDPIGPQPLKSTVLGLLLGLALSLAAVFVLEYLDYTVKNIAQLEKRYRLPLFGVIPHKSGDVEMTKPGGNLISLEHPDIPILEAFRTLRTNLILSNTGNKGQVIMITGPGEATGKSFTAINMAAVLSLRTQGSVVLVDADMREPVVHEAFDVRQAPGLSDLLLGRATLPEVLHIAPINNLAVIPAGMQPPNPAELLASSRMSETLDTLREMYDHVVIDTPPILPVADALEIAPLADLALLIVRLNYSKWPAVDESLRQLLAGVERSPGIIVNDFSEPSGALGRLSYGANHRYHYRYGYKYGGATASKVPQGRLAQLATWTGRLFGVINWPDK